MLKLYRNLKFIPVSTLLRYIKTPTNDLIESFGRLISEPHGPGQDSEVD